MKLTRLFIVSIILLIGITSCGHKTDKDKELSELRQLAELDRREMENQYADFAQQYGEMKKAVKDDALIARLDAEQKRAEGLLQELRQTKAKDASEILRLKRELATVRAVLRDYVRQVDSLARANHTLTNERDAARADAQRTREENSGLSARNASLNATVQIAARLNASGISITPMKKNGKSTHKSKDVKSFGVSFSIARNVTAQTGNKIIYLRLMKPNQTVVNNSGSFSYENRSVEYSAAKTIEYDGQEARVTMFVPVGEFINGGTYTAYLFCDGQMIGSDSVSIN